MPAHNHKFTLCLKKLIPHHLKKTKCYDLL